MWNHLDLKCPSDDLSEYPPQDQYLIEDLRELVTVLTTAADSLTTENPLWSEMQVLRNIQVKYKRILGCDKFLVHLQRVGHCLKKMVLLNLSRAYLDLAQRYLFRLQDAMYSTLHLPSRQQLEYVLVRTLSAAKLISEGIKYSRDAFCRLQDAMYSTLHLPSRQQLEYVLVRTLSAAKLISEGIKYSRDAFCFLIRKLKVGHLILDLVMATSVTARLNILLRAKLEELCSTYKQVLNWRYKVKSGAHTWPMKLDLPLDLGDWLKSFESSILEPIPMSEADVYKLTNFLKSGHREKSKDQDSDSESIILLGEVNKRKNTSCVQNGSRTGNTDYGEVIPRKKIKTHHLTSEHESVLQRVTQVQSFKELEKLWTDIQNYASNYFPKTLTDKKKRVINNFFSQIKTSLSPKKYNKTAKVDLQFFLKAILLFCKNLGFDSEDTERCIKQMKSPKDPNRDAVELKPVKKFKELKNLYSRLCDILNFTGEAEKQQKLRKIFKRRIADIKLLKQNGDIKIAKQLIYCTSKVLLTLCQQ